MANYLVKNRIYDSLQRCISIAGRGKGKGKAVPVFFLLSEHHAVKAYWGVEA